MRPVEKSGGMCPCPTTPLLYVILRKQQYKNLGVTIDNNNITVPKAVTKWLS